jgi:hypothetical protein
MFTTHQVMPFCYGEYIWIQLLGVSPEVRNWDMEAVLRRHYGRHHIMPRSQ